MCSHRHSPGSHSLFWCTQSLGRPPFFANTTTSDSYMPMLVSVVTSNRKDCTGREGKERKGKRREEKGMACVMHVCQQLPRKEGKGKERKGKEGKRREGKGKEGIGREGKGKERKGKERKGREGEGREEKGREGKGRDRKGREGEGRNAHLHALGKIQGVVGEVARPHLAGPRDGRAPLLIRQAEHELRGFDRAVDAVVAVLARAHGRRLAGALAVTAASKERKGKEREGKRREGKGREGREGKGREGKRGEQMKGNERRGRKKRKGRKGKEKKGKEWHA